MRNVFQLLVALPLLVVQVASSLPGSVTASFTANAETDGSTNKIVLNTNSLNPITNETSNPDFDRDVLEPLRAAQTAKAAAEAAKAKAAIAARRTVKTVRPLIIDTGDVWSRLRFCEAGGIYNRNSGNGYYGAYQFDIRTWGNYGGYARADLAPPAVQDEKARITQAARGWYPWPACARKLGLI